MKPLAIALIAMLTLLASACSREERKLAKAPSSVPSPGIGAAQGDIHPGAAGAGLAETVSSRSYDGENAYELSQGKQLFRWYNCSGCHSQGGGGMGPALMDNRWIYGHEPDQIFKTIMEGRPNGMPSFHGRIPEARKAFESGLARAPQRVQALMGLQKAQTLLNDPAAAQTDKTLHQIYGHADHPLQSSSSGNR